MTVKELIEYLQQCPEDYMLCVELLDGSLYRLDSIGIDNEHLEVDLKAV